MASGKALYSIKVVVLGFICFIVGAIAVVLPNWGYFYSLENPNFEQGYFGPWRVCKKLLYNREKCGSEVSPFRPSTAVYIAGVVGAIGVSILGYFCVLSLLQLAMIFLKGRFVLKYTYLVMFKLALALLAALLSIAAAGLFAVQGDDIRFSATMGEAFYVQIVCIMINSLLFIMSVYDTLFSRRTGGDPTYPHLESDGTRITPRNNPGFKDGRDDSNDASFAFNASNATELTHVVGVTSTHSITGVNNDACNTDYLEMSEGLPCDNTDRDISSSCDNVDVECRE